jgi:hypothetical protein
MAWQPILTLMVRNLIGDTGDTQNYTDSRIQEALLVSGLITTQDYAFPTSYTFDFDSTNISPDPTSTSSSDPVAMALFTLKAACMLNLNTYQNAVKTGIRVRDGDSEIDTTSGFKGYRDILELGPCGAYNKLLQDLRYKRSMKAGKAIGSPFTHSKFWLTDNFNTIDFFNNLYIR